MGSRANSVDVPRRWGRISPRAAARKGTAELHRFLQIASGSASELDYHLLLAKDLNYLAATDYQRVEKQLLEFRRMLTALLRKVGTDRDVANC